MDMTFMGKFLVQGRDAGKVLDYIAANSVNGPVETITYTQFLNERGKVEADVTVTKQTKERFIVVVTDTMHRHVETWIKRHIPSDAHCFVTDITGGIGQLNVQGPRSRELLQSITSADLSNDAFPFRTAREIDIGFGRVLCNRITYVGELGYELNIPAEQAVHVYDRVVEAGKNFGLRHAGLRALGSLRMEKGYRDYGHDIDNTDDAYEVGLGFVVDPAPVAGAGQGPRATALPRRGHLSKQQGGGLCPRGKLRIHPRWRRGSGHDRSRRARQQGLPERGRVGGRHRRQEVPGRGFSETHV